MCNSRSDEFLCMVERCFGNFHELDYKLLVQLNDYWWKTNDHKYSSFSNWRNHIHVAYANTNINANYNPYLDVSRAFNNYKERDYEETINEERDPNDANAIGNLDYDLVTDNVSYHDNEEKEHIDEDRCEFLRNPRQEPPVYKIRRFAMIKYSFGSNENYIAIKECEYEDLTRTEDDACHGYQEIFRIIDEGWFMIRAK
nr:hypothetical protein [Tanacetum cinerariifolium]